MSNGAIPDWTANGVLPPINVLDPTSPNRSPYRVALTDLVLRFGASTERREIIDGLLKYRGALHNAGVSEGFQWIDGSFLEDIELLGGRPPNDIDVVTFYRLPQGVTQQSILSRDPDLFNHESVKEKFKVDSYLLDLKTRTEDLVRAATYWYGVWSHRRNFEWKGFIEVNLANGEDFDAAKTLAAQIEEGGRA